MTVQWSRELLEHFVAPGIQDFNRAHIPELSPDLVASRNWMFDHFLNNVFQAQYKDPVRQQVINCIYRTQTAVKAYQEAKSLTNSYLSKSKSGSPIINLYFEALSTWETCFLNWQILVQIYNRLISPEQNFIRGDGSIDDRAYSIANSIKHSGGAGSDYIVPIWLTNDGFQTQDHKVSYEELAQLLSEAGEFARQIINPKLVGSPVTKP